MGSYLGLRLGDSTPATRASVGRTLLALFCRLYLKGVNSRGVFGVAAMAPPALQLREKPGSDGRVDVTTFLEWPSVTKTSHDKMNHKTTRGDDGRGGVVRGHDGYLHISGLLQRLRACARHPAKHRKTTVVPTCATIAFREMSSTALMKYCFPSRYM